MGSCFSLVYQRYICVTLRENVGRQHFHKLSSERRIGQLAPATLPDVILGPEVAVIDFTHTHTDTNIKL